jgi:transcriptional antiterminator RfaH
MTMSTEHRGSATGPDAPRWYLLQSHPRQADRAEENLQRQGFKVFHPRIRVERVRRGRPTVVEESLFANYLFIRLQRWVDNWYPLRSTRGVSRLVTFGRDPLPVADGLIDEIRRRVDEGQQPAPAFREGEHVLIAAGPFRGLDAIFKARKDEQRVLLLIELLHRQVAVAVPVGSIRRTA